MSCVPRGRLWLLTAGLWFSVGCRAGIDVSPDASLATDAGPEPNYIPDPDGGFAIVLPPSEGTLDVEIGVPDAETGIQFHALVPGGLIPFDGVGQTGLTARVALRVRTPSGAPLQEAIVQLDLVRVDDDSIRPAMNRLRDSATNLRCDDTGACIYAPLHLQILHLNSPSALGGTVVTVKAHLIDPNAPTVFGTAWSWGVLSKLE